jgi:beta-hydroxylase
MWGYGYRVDANCARCPETIKLVEQIPGLRTAMFSIHAPGVHIPLHKGVTKGMITCHLALKTPTAREKCRIEVNGESYSWREGETFIFDDTYKHEVWNDTDEDRVILLIQFDRPLRFPGSLLRSAILGAIRLSPFVQDAKRNMSRWVDRMKQAEKAAGSQS